MGIIDKTVEWRDAYRSAMSGTVLDKIQMVRMVSCELPSGNGGTINIKLPMAVSGYLVESGGVPYEVDASKIINVS